MTDAFDDFDDDLRQPADAENLIRQAVDVVSTAKQMPLSSSVMLPRDEVLDLLEGALEMLPEELRQARWLLREREEFMAEKQREADAVLEDVKAQAERLVSRTELVRQARATAAKIIEEAEESARRMRHEAEDFCDQKLAGMEIVLERVLKTVAAGREKLQPALDDPDAPNQLEEIEVEEDIFFDQDKL
jgi:cell division septum initiation protein DivIVA